MRSRRRLITLLCAAAPLSAAAVALADEPPAPAPAATAPAPAATAPAPRASAAQAHHRAAHRVLVHRDQRLARRAAQLAHRRVSARRHLVVRAWSNHRLRSHIHRLRRQITALRRRAGVPAYLAGILRRIAFCESRGNPRAIGGGGAFRGRYQMTFATWRAVGGSGDPAAASAREQDHRAALLYRRYGAGQWPVCGR